MSELDDKAEKFLQSSVNNYRILIDTCSLLDQYADYFWYHIIPYLQSSQKKIVVPYRVYQEVKKFADNPSFCVNKAPGLNERAKTVLRQIIQLHQAGLIEIFGDPSDNFVDNVFQTVFTQYRIKYNLFLITQDKKLSHDIVRIGESQAVSTPYQICVAKINKYGYLSVFRDNEEFASRNASTTSGRRSSNTSVPDTERFARSTSIRQISGKLSVSTQTSEGSWLLAQRNGNSKTLQLGKSLGSGGEGTIYATTIPGFVAKIYKPDKLDRAKYEKLRLMMTKSISCEGVCFPVALLYNQRNEFVGYLMPEAKGKKLQTSVFIPQLLKRNFPHWTRVETVTLCITILKKLLYLHERNIILGDINPNNILVVSPTEVYFVDTDSYQIEGFPCPVGTINYTAPEIQRKDFSTFLRSPGNEYFAVATLLFMIMLPGKPPYSLQGGEDQINNIINGDFAYASGERTNGKTPEGLWRYCWSHLPRYLKDDLYETFHRGGTHSTEKNRYTTRNWLDKFERYLKLLKDGTLVEQDAMAVDIFPTRLKKNPNTSYIRCRICGTEVDESKTKNGLCRNCASKVYQQATCSECGKIFEITYGERDFYEQRGLCLPKKCKNCRGHKSYVYTYHPSPSSDRGPAQGANQTTTQSVNRTSEPIQKTRRKKSGSCFITTAACDYFGKPDDCYELTTLRQFRDGWLAYQPGGEEIIQEYYRIAPSIIEALNSSELRDEAYKKIWKSYILPCVRMIEQTDYENCRIHYESMVLALKASVLNIAPRN